MKKSEKTKGKKQLFSSNLLRVARYIFYINFTGGNRKVLPSECKLDQLMLK